MTSEPQLRHVLRLCDSYRHWTGRELLPDVHVPQQWAEALFEAPFIVVSHGVEADPLLNYGNRRALELWEMTWEEFVHTPSRLTAEVPNQAERARLLSEVERHGFIADYAGVRISKSGRRFRIERATVWNLLDEAGQYCGQAATFNAWCYL